MDMPPVHMCVFLNYEHEQLKAKILELENHIIHLEKIRSEKKSDHHYSCSISCQTTTPVQQQLNLLPHPVRSSADEEAHLQRLVNAQNELLKKYEQDAIVSHRQRQLQVSPPTALIDDYERRLIRSRKAKEQAEQRALAAQKRMNKLEERYEHMRRKMSVFDDGFFEEVNQLKFAVQQAVGLSREYEKTIQMLSAQLGITYPVENS
ncbi:unnamed protein product [Adineta ricciae]|uniref:Uncharacterized protein n=1 Tax=Adineta ricciae TaxID=249248 RepID=A0A815H2P2_ADIRI|nr:unnamed protein product [Adineta ricciae]